MDDIRIDKLTDRVRKLIARCQELETLNQELLTSQQQLYEERETQVALNQQVAQALAQLVRQLIPAGESR